MINDPILVNDWHPVTTLAALDQQNPLRARLLDEDIVIWQNEGHLYAWQDLCVHRGARLSLGSVQNNRLVCPYHGWHYASNGRCVHIPAHPEQKPPDKAQVKTYQAQAKYDLVWVSLGTPTHTIPLFSEWQDPRFRTILCGPYTFEAAAPRVIENFLDVAHFPFVHAGSLGDPTHPEIADYAAHITAEGVVAEDITVWQPDPDGTGQGAAVTYTYKVLRPLVAYFVKTKGTTFAAYYAVSPVAPLQTKGWVLLAMNYAFEQPENELRAFQDAITAEDIPIVESQRPELLPLDLQAELHLRSDRTAIAYRQWLNMLGLSFGTS